MIANDMVKQEIKQYAIFCFLEWRGLSFPILQLSVTLNTLPLFISFNMVIHQATHTHLKEFTNITSSLIYIISFHSPSSLTLSPFITLNCIFHQTAAFQFVINSLWSHFIWLHWLSKLSKTMIPTKCSLHQASSNLKS